MTLFTTWLDTFLSEKNWTAQRWELTGPDWETHWIDGDVVVEAIKDASTREQQKVKDALVAIDFANGDVNRYFRHLAGALVAQ